MEAFDLAELALSAQSRLDTSWALFLSINSTIMAGVILIQRTFSNLEKSIGIGMYLVVILLNYMVTNSSLNLLTSIYVDLSKFEFVPDDPGHAVVQQMTSFFNESIFWNQPILVPTIYIAAVIMIVLTIIFDEKFTKTKMDVI
ncbi:MAG: hypothetical protein GKR91_17370 [Pseudomonadales bacterium]|nr:hypothetical protein [Pseudomonadales bacterium]